MQRATAATTSLAALLMVVLLSEATARVSASVGVSASERQSQAGPVAITTPDGVVLQGIYRDGGARSDVGLLLVHGFGGTFLGEPLATLGARLADRCYATPWISMR